MKRRINQYGLDWHELVIKLLQRGPQCRQLPVGAVEPSGTDLHQTRTLGDTPLLTDMRLPVRPDSGQVKCDPGSADSSWEEHREARWRSGGVILSAGRAMTAGYP